MFWNKKVKTKESNLDSAMIELGREVERGFLLWNNMFENYYRNSSSDPYAVIEEILNNKSLTNADRINEANKILESSRAYRNKLREYSLTCAGFITTNLDRFEKMLEPLFKIKSHDREKEWIKLSRDLSKVYARKIIAIENLTDFFDYFFEGFVKRGADMTGDTLEGEIEYFDNKKNTYSSLISIVKEDIKKIEPNRSNIAEGFWGKLNSYYEGGSYSKLVNEIKK